MKLRIYFLLLFIGLASAASSQVPKSVTRDTLPDFARSFSKGNEFNIHGDRLIRREDKVLYLRIMDSTGSYVKTEFFLENDSTYFRKEYNHDGGYFSIGEITVRNKVVRIDSVYTEDAINPGEYFLEIYYFKEVIRSGEWKEYLSICRLFTHVWEGRYDSDKRTGIWKHWIKARSGRWYLTETFDYSGLPAAVTYADNEIHTLTFDSLNQQLVGGWRNIADDTCSLRELEHCNRNSEGKFPDYCFYWRYELKADGTARINDYESDDGVPGMWKLERSGEQYVLTIVSSDGKTESFRLVYMDRKGYLLLYEK